MVARLDDKVWTKVKDELLKLNPKPKWTDVLISQTQAPESNGASQISMHVETTKVTKSYLEFLEGQIRLCARGPEWNLVLQQRLDALKPHLNEKLLSISINNNTINNIVDSIYILLEPRNLKLIHIEYC